jgi:Zn ribbon nucleic-acid-binding protein
MLIAKAVCPKCKVDFIVDQKLWNVGTVPLRCIGCGHAFLPPASPKSLSVEEAVNAAVPIRIWP